MNIYRIIDILFVIFHTSLIIFNLFGWIWRRTRLWNLGTLVLTASSWLILGLIIGSLGYCPLTDWHFRVLERLGETDLPVSYIKYLTDRIAGIDIKESIIDKIVLWCLLGAIVISFLLNLRDWFRRRV